MSFFTNLRADRLITEIRSSEDQASPVLQKAVARLKDLGPGAIEPVFAALPDASKTATIAFVEVKARPSLDDALSAITETKRRRICRAAAVWVARNPFAAQGWTLRGDAILVGGWRPPLHIEDAFALELSD